MRDVSFPNLTISIFSIDIESHLNQLIDVNIEARRLMSETHPKHLSTGDRKQAIAAAARSLIIERGFEGLRTREIADRVGINIATLHYHVPSKEALIELVAQSMQDEFVAQHMRTCREGLTALEQLNLQYAEIRETRDNNPELLQVMEVLSRRARHDENVARYVRPLTRRWYEQFVAILKQGVETGIFRPDLDPAAGAYMVIGGIIATNSSPEPGHAALDSVAAEVIRSFIAHSTKD
jgi:AcrR family transcriptional regulator